VTPSPEEEPIHVVDKRRIDPDTGAVRDAPVEEVEVADGAVEPASPSREEELLADLQRVSAEYANYRKRVDRDRVAVVELANLGLLESLMPLLDNIELARQHGDLEGAFKGVGESLEQLADKHGLERYGAKGEPFDPAVHHALVQAPEDPEATVTVVAEVLQPGWRLRSGRVLRPAGVAVSEPGSTGSTGATDVTEQS
jgi:molecular chaperone GrpE